MNILKFSREPRCPRPCGWWSHVTNKNINVSSIQAAKTGVLGNVNGWAAFDKITILKNWSNNLIYDYQAHMLKGMAWSAVLYRQLLQHLGSAKDTCFTPVRGSGNEVHSNRCKSFTTSSKILRKTSISCSSDSVYGLTVKKLCYAGQFHSNRSHYLLVAE
jgi:hypothetical protein